MKIKKYVKYVKKSSAMMIKTRKKTDHCHYTKKSRGAAYSECNLRYNVPKKSQ